MMSSPIRVPAHRLETARLKSILRNSMAYESFLFMYRRYGALISQDSEHLPGEVIVGRRINRQFISAMAIIVGMFGTHRQFSLCAHSCDPRFRSCRSNLDRILPSTGSIGAHFCNRLGVLGPHRLQMFTTPSAVGADTHSISDQPKRYSFSNVTTHIETWYGTAIYLSHFRQCRTPILSKDAICPTNERRKATEPDACESEIAHATLAEPRRIARWGWRGERARTTLMT